MKYQLPLLATLACITASIMLPVASAESALLAGTTDLVTQGAKPDPLEECYKETGDSSTRPDVAQCLVKKAQSEGLRLSETYKAEVQNLKGIDSSGVPAALVSLEKSQKAFEAFRQAECQRIGDAYLGGTGAGEFQQDCEIRLTRWRIDVLNSH